MSITDLYGHGDMHYGFIDSGLSGVEVEEIGNLEFNNKI